MKFLRIGICLMLLSAGFLHAQESKPSAGNMIHLGMWVTDMQEMIDFLGAVSSFKVVSREARATGGERVYMMDRNHQIMELLSASDVVAHPEFDLHPLGRVAGVAHIALAVDDIVTLKALMQEKGYRVLRQVPEDFADGPITSESGVHRILFIAGPSAVTFEFFEFVEETTFVYPED